MDPSLREEKESLSDELVELKDALVKRRKEGFSSARQLQRERDSLCVQILVRVYMVSPVHLLSHLEGIT